MTEEETVHDCDRANVAWILSFGFAQDRLPLVRMTLREDSKKAPAYFVGAFLCVALSAVLFFPSIFG
jgi:hypothetical protein